MIFLVQCEDIITCEITCFIGSPTDIQYVLVLATSRMSDKKSFTFCFLQKRMLDVFVFFFDTSAYSISTMPSLCSADGCTKVAIKKTAEINVERGGHAFYCKTVWLLIFPLATALQVASWPFFPCSMPQTIHLNACPSDNARRRLLTQMEQNWGAKVKLWKEDSARSMVE